MGTLRDEGLGPIERGRAEALLATGAPEDVSRALLRIALHDPDWEYVARAALAHLFHPDVWVRRNAATSLGHLVRLHGQLHTPVVVPVLLALMDDPEVAG
jgi:hypothetical protein